MRGEGDVLFVLCICCCPHSTQHSLLCPQCTHHTRSATTQSHAEPATANTTAAHHDHRQTTTSTVAQQPTQQVRFAAHLQGVTCTVTHPPHVSAASCRRAVLQGGFAAAAAVLVQLSAAGGSQARQEPKPDGVDVADSPFVQGEGCSSVLGGVAVWGPHLAAAELPCLLACCRVAEAQPREEGGTEKGAAGSILQEKLQGD